MYKTKRDRFITVTMLVSLVLIIAAFVIPYSIDFAIDGTVKIGETFMVFLLLLFSLSIILWPMVVIRYEFFEHYLLVKGGPFRSKIRYDEITKVKGTYFTVGDTLAGYRILGSRDGVEINYNTGLMGHIRISPERKDQFLDELKARAPHAHYS